MGINGRIVQPTIRVARNLPQSGAGGPRLAVCAADLLIDPKGQLLTSPRPGHTVYNQRRQKGPALNFLNRLGQITIDPSADVGEQFVRPGGN